MFKKISRSRFRQDSLNGYENICIPENICGRYLLKSPIETVVKYKRNVVIPTGLACELEEEILLIVVDGKVSVVNEKYNIDKDGHILIEIENTSSDSIEIHPGDVIAEAYVLKVKYND